MSASSIITDETLPALKKALADLDRADRELELAQRAGLMAGPFGAQLKAQQEGVAKTREALTTFMQVYFPGQ